MIFTTKAEYGVRLLIQLGRRGDGHPVSLKAIAEAENLPLAYCERIAALLKKADLVTSTRGAHGGYVLAMPSEEITMDRVVLALEGAIAPMECFIEEGADGRVQCSHHDAEAEHCTRPSAPSSMKHSIGAMAPSRARTTRSMVISSDGMAST